MRDITALGRTAILALLVTIVTTFLFVTGKRHAGLFVLTTVLSGALLNNPSDAYLCASAPRYRHSTHSGLYIELSEWSRSKFGCLLSDARLDARSDASFPHCSHSFIVTAAILTASVSVSRIYIGVHYPSDVLAGWCFGIAWALTCQILMSHFLRTGRIEQPSDYMVGMADHAWTSLGSTLVVMGNQKVGS